MSRSSLLMYPLPKTSPAPANLTWLQQQCDPRVCPSRCRRSAASALSGASVLGTSALLHEASCSARPPPELWPGSVIRCEAGLHVHQLR